MAKALVGGGIAAWALAAVLLAIVFTASSGGGSSGGAEVADLQSAGLLPILMAGNLVTLAAALLVVGAIFVASAALLHRR